MLSDADYAILQLVDDSGTLVEDDFAGPYPRSPKITESLFRLRNLADRGFLYQGSRKDDTLPFGQDISYTYRLTIAGKDKLSAFCKKREQESKQRAEADAQEHKADRLRVKEARRSWWQFWLGLLIGWILGNITPFGVWDWLMSIIK